MARVVGRTVLAGLLLLVSVVLSGSLQAGTLSSGLFSEAHRSAAGCLTDQPVSASSDVGRQGGCHDPGMVDGMATCNAVHCAALHGSLGAGVAQAMIVPLLGWLGPPVLPMPEGVGVDPALRPPRSM